MAIYLNGLPHYHGGMIITSYLQKDAIVSEETFCNFSLNQASFRRAGTST